jgi:hypothetical protein
MTGKFSSVCRRDKSLSGVNQNVSKCDIPGTRMERTKPWEAWDDQVILE